jgi:hypothetical protein
MNMNLSTFRRSFNPRREFNPANRKDLIELQFFKKNGKWKNGCPFFLEDPFVEIPAMCESKFTNFMLEKMK